MDHSVFIYGLRYPNRIFVGGLAKDTAAEELANFFENFGTVIEAKIILNEHGISKGYGFITFANPSEVVNIMQQGQLFFKNRKLNLGPAVRKQTPDTPGQPVVLVATHQSSQRASNTARSPCSTSPPVIGSEMLPPFLYY